MDVRVFPHHSDALPLGIKLEELAAATVGGDITFVLVNYK